ncbi:14408_t:CDS:2, partial [Gigaspora rosea]
MDETMSEVKISYKKNKSITKEEACLRIIEGSPRNQYLFLPECEIIVGRKDSNYIVIKDLRIDEAHAKIKKNKGKVDIVGIGLKSRIFINGKQLKFRTSHTLQKNDKIEIGRSTFQYLPAGEFKNFIDPLLQIYNIDYLLKSSETGFRNGQNMSLLLMVCDSDYFGKINKNYGHEARDYILVELSKLIQNECGDKNVFARYEGEKFAILLINTNLKLAYGVAEKIRSSIGTYQFIVNDEILPPITFSIGISEVNSSVKKSKDLLNHAEEACRKAKEYAYKKLQSPIPSQIPPYPPFSPKENEVLKINKKWYSILGEELPLIEPQQYFILNKIIPQPKLSYFKMWGVDILKAENFVNLINDEDEESFNDAESSDDEEPSNNESKLENQKLIKNNRLSRFDCIAALFASTETTVVQDIFRIISQFPIALPLLMPNLDKAEKFKVILPSYTGTAIKWYTSNGLIMENRIFEDSFKMIVAVRIGMNPQGKSTILNQLMVSKYMFTSHSEPRADYGIPLMINGSVEFVWLTEETCGVDLWNSVFKSYYKEEGRNEIALLANLHGDALDYPDQIEFLKQLPSCFLVFLMPGYDENQMVEFTNLIGSKKVIYIYVNPENSVKGKDNYTIDTKSLMDYKTIQVACKMFKDVLDHNPTDSGRFSINTLKMGKTLQFAENLVCVESQKIIDFIKEKTCRYIRLKIMQLQTKQSGYDCLQFWECTPELQELMRSFSSIIVLPIRVRRRALAHLEKEISRLSTVETSKPWNDVLSKRKELINANIMNNDQEKMNKIREEITKLYEEVDNTSLRIEHFFRELGH